MPEQLHNGHRQRMRKRIKDHGIGNLQEHEVLEYLLYSFVPRRDTNALAHRLIDEFGSLAGVLSAKPVHLQKISGMTENASLFLSVLADIMREYYFRATSSGDKTALVNNSMAKSYIGKFFAGLNEERLYAVALDINDCVIGQKEWSSGKRAKIEVTAPQISEFAERTKAVSILLAHNHPGGSVHPSIGDVNLTRDIYILLDLLGYKLQDHLIFNNKGECYSFWENNYFKEWELR